MCYSVPVPFSCVSSTAPFYLAQCCHMLRGRHALARECLCQWQRSRDSSGSPCQVLALGSTRRLHECQPHDTKPARHALTAIAFLKARRWRRCNPAQENTLDCWPFESDPTWQRSHCPLQLQLLHPCLGRMAAAVHGDGQMDPSREYSCERSTHRCGHWIPCRAHKRTQSAPISGRCRSASTAMFFSRSQTKTPSARHRVRCGIERSRDPGAGGCFVEGFHSLLPRGHFGTSGHSVGRTFLPVHVLEKVEMR